MRIKLIFRTALIGLIGASTLTPAQAGTWSPAIKVPKFGEYGTVLATGMDYAGNLTAIGGNYVCCATNNTVASTALAGKPFTSPIVIAPYITSPYNHSPITLQSTPAGLTTLLYSDPASFIPTSVEHPVGSAWKPPVQITNQLFPYNFFVANDAGNEAIVADSGNVINTGISAVVRSAGNPWGNIQSLATFGPTQGLSSVMAPNSTLAFAYDTYIHHQISRYYNYNDNYVLHVATLVPGSSVWVDSGPLTGPESSPHDSAKLAADGSGRIGLLTNDGSNLVSMVKLNGIWSNPTTVAPLSTTLYTKSYSNIFSDVAGNATIWYRGAAINGTGLNAIYTIDGNLATNTWSASKQLASFDPASFCSYAANSKGSAVATWTVPGTTKRSLVAMTKAGSGQAWSTPVTIGSETAANAVPGLFTAQLPMINVNGQIAVPYSYSTWEFNNALGGYLQMNNTYVARYNP